MDYSTLKKIQLSNGFQWFDEPFKPNIIGVRTKLIVPNVMNDLKFVAWKDKTGKEFLLSFTQTTLPGKYYLESKEFRPKEGCAILLANKQYHSWIMGIHGKVRPHKGLLQLVGGVDIARDNNTNPYAEVSGPDTKIFLNQYIGCNHHGPWQDVEVKLIDQNSAACQVLNNKKYQEQMMWVVEEYHQVVLGYKPTPEQIFANLSEKDKNKQWFKKIIISYTLYDEVNFKVK